MLTRIQNGREVVLSDEEEAAVRAEWAANAPTANQLIDAQIVQIESAHQITKRDYREFKLAVATQAGLPSAWLDPAQPDPSALPQFKALGFGLQIAITEERAARALRAQRT